MNFRKHVPFIKKGLEVSQLSFSGGRTAVSVANHGGLTHVNYYGAQRFGDVMFYKALEHSVWQQLLRLCVSVDGDLYYLEFFNTSVFPFGYESECELGGVAFRHGMFLLNDAMVYTVEILANPQAKKVFAKILHMDGCVRVEKPTRTWNGFHFDEPANLAVASVIDEVPEAVLRQEYEISKNALTQKSSFGHREPLRSEIFLGVTSDIGIHMEKTPETFRKFKFSTTEFAGSAAICLLFGHAGREKFLNRAAQLRTSMVEEVRSLRLQFKERMRTQPHIRLANKTVESLLLNVAPIMDSLKVKDIPGGMRAADSGYWIWGWDSIVHSDALGFANDSAYLAQMLEFYRRHADPKLGIFHAMTLDQKPFLAMAFSAQCLYAIMLYNTYVFTGDKKLLAEYFPFAKTIVDRAGADEVAESGLIRGVALYPDMPEDLEQDGDDISVFNNGIYYQALRAMEELAIEGGDQPAAADFSTRARRLRENFPKFFDEEKGYFYDSLSAKDFAPRRHYPNYAILWVTPFAQDLAEQWPGKIAKFMKANLAAHHGIRMLPKWDSRFMYDGNQLGMAMPVVENFFREMMRISQDAEGVAQLLGNIEWFWSKVCVPESITCECENHGITVDNPGRKQGFCAKAWLTMFYHVVAGINLDRHGISFSPSDSIEISIKNLTVRSKRLDIEITGHGWNIETLTLNGEQVAAPFTIPYDRLMKRNTIVVRRRA